jgi:hypothetical protein
VDAAWHKLEDLAEERFSNIPKSPGVYFVRWSRGGKPVPIHRLGGCDNKGILYIGSSKKDLRRIREFWKAIGEKNVERHTIFATLAFCRPPFCGLSGLVKLSELEVSWEVLGSPEDARGQEWAAIYLYCRRCKEPPSLNLNIGRRRYMILDLGRLDESFLVLEPSKRPSSSPLRKPFIASLQ